MSNQDPKCNFCHLSMGDVHTGMSFLTIADKNVCENCLEQMWRSMKARVTGIREIVFLMEFIELPHNRRTAAQYTDRPIT